jgi:hypothetical protein
VTPSVWERPDFCVECGTPLVEGVRPTREFDGMTGRRGREAFLECPSRRGRLPYPFGHWRFVEFQADCWRRTS